MRRPAYDTTIREMQRQTRLGGLQGSTDISPPTNPDVSGTTGSVDPTTGVFTPFGRYDIDGYPFRYKV
jgi:hypothetical protein